MPIGSSMLVFAPTATSTASPGDASAFITTSVQLPDRTGQITVWVPVPAADADRKL